MTRFIEILWFIGLLAGPGSTALAQAPAEKLLLTGSGSTALAQTPSEKLLISDSILHIKWHAKWIEAPGQPANGYGIYHFRKMIDLHSKPATFIVHVSGDNRYKLYVNGDLVALGPARGDLFHWYYETVDLAPFLKAGSNQLAAVVWNDGEWKPQAQLTYRTAFILAGNSAAERIADTGPGWKAIADSAYTAFTPRVTGYYYLTGPGEKINYHRYPENWEGLSFNDQTWRAAKPVFEGSPKGSFDWSDGWMLLPAMIPAPELRVQRLQRIRIATGMPMPAYDAAKPFRIMVPAHSHIKFLIDQGFLTNAYPVLKFSAGAGAGLSLAYAEALYIKDIKDPQSNVKANRNQVENMRFSGKTDSLVADGKEHSFSPLWYRTYRFLKLEVQTGNEALEIEDCYGLFTGYPFILNAAFQTGDSVLTRIFQTGWHTARSCAVETYMDCPYYEELQYAGDTRIQALVSIFNSGDDRLMRQAITQLDYSRIPEGITYSRYPSTHQLIPPFSLWWIGMLHDYYQYRNDPAFIRSMLEGSRQVLKFFEKYQQADGSLKPVPYWNFTDWAVAPGWNSGIAPNDPVLGSAEMDLQLLWACQLAEEMERSLGSKELAMTYAGRVMLLKKTIRAKYWNREQGLFTDLKGRKVFSQHTNSLAILTGVVEGAQARELAGKILKDKHLVQATIYFRYYVNQALVKAGLGNEYLNLLGDWKTQLDHGLSTWAEISDVDHARSDCHAWGASPNIEFIRTVLGIDAATPGFTRIRIEPHLGRLEKASGSMPHPNGLISVNYEKKGSQWFIRITLPQKTRGSLIWKGLRFELDAGKETILKV